MLNIICRQFYKSRKMKKKKDCQKLKKIKEKKLFRLHDELFYDLTCLKLVCVIYVDFVVN